MVLSMDRWVGKVAVVTGTSAGIGVAIAEALVEQGLIVAGIARRADKVETLAKNLSNKKGKLYAVKADLTKEDIINAFKWITGNLGPIHILVNNAGYGEPSTLVDGDTDIWKQTLNVNVLGLSIATREAVKDMRKNNVDGHIIHINSVLGHEVNEVPLLNVYPASKYAVTALAETLRLELLRLKLKIKITSVSPGRTDTELLAENLKMNGVDYERTLAEKCIIEPDNIADAVVYALSTPPHVQVQEITVRSLDETLIS